MSSDQDNTQFVPENEAVEAQQSGIDAEQEDQAQARSEETGQISQRRSHQITLATHLLTRRRGG